MPYSGLSLTDFKLPDKYNKKAGNQTALDGFLLVLFFFYFPMKSSGAHILSSRGKILMSAGPAYFFMHVL